MIGANVKVEWDEVQQVLPHLGDDVHLKIHNAVLQLRIGKLEEEIDRLRHAVGILEEATKQRREGDG